MNIHDWAARWGIPQAAIAELLTEPPPVESIGGNFGSESAIQDKCRLLASAQGIVTWRNNVGAGELIKGGFVRWGLANETAAQNDRLKSSDVIGIKPGGQFYAREIKAPNWYYRGTPRELAQLNFINLVNRLGGDAAFYTAGTP